jgi:hypothetical protein
VGRKRQEGKCCDITVAAISPVEPVCVNTSLSLRPTMVSIVSGPSYGSYRGSSCI